MRKYAGLFALVLLLTTVSGTGLSDDGKDAGSGAALDAVSRAGTEKIEWICGMHPSVRMNEPGKCPICNMDLVKAGGQTDKEGGPVRIELGERARMLAGVSTSEVRFLPLFKEIQTVGRVDYDERRVVNVTARVAGRIDRLYVDFAGTEVRRGEPLVQLYSPSLVSTQDEYLWAIKMKERMEGGARSEALQGAESLIGAARSRLLLWGITDSQIAELERSGISKSQMTITSPVSGTVVRKMATEGDYVKQGDHLYHIADLSNLWVYADVYESDLSWIRVGQPVAFTALAYGDQEFTGNVSFIDPFLDERTRSVKLRVDVPNQSLELRPGMFVDVTIKAVPEGEGEYYVCPMHPEVVSPSAGDCHLCGMDLVMMKEGVAMALPKSAVLDTGRRKIVYVEKEPGVYEAREVALGPEALAEAGGRIAAYYPVKRGLAEGERVVTRGNFLLDSQSQLGGPAASMYDGSLGAEDPAGPQHRH